MKHIVQFSGGKDSTAMLLMMIEREMPIDEIIYCDTGKEFPQMYDHISKVEKHIGRKVTVLRADHSFDYYFAEHIRTKGKFKGIKGYGWASMMNRWCTGLLKTRVSEKYFLGKGGYIKYIGIAADEPKRHKNIAKNVIHPLFDWGITESKALEYCYNRGFDWNGLRMLFPAPAVDPDGSVVPLAHTTAVELCEATDLYLCDKWRYAPLVVAILCRPEGEPYREQTCRHRAWSMKKLPMDIVLRLYDMLRQAHRYLKRNYPLCYETPRTNGEKTGREGPTWNELLLWAGHFRIDEIEPVRRMNCHDFMDLVQSRIKMNG